MTAERFYSEPDDENVVMAFCELCGRRLGLRQMFYFPSFLELVAEKCVDQDECKSYRQQMRMVWMREG